MARKYSFSVYDRKHLKNLLARAKQIDDLFDQAAREGCRIGEGTGFKDGEFFFDNYPTAKKRIEELLAGLHKGLLTTMTEGDREEWLLSAAKNDAMVDSLFGARAKYGAVAEKWKEPNLKALDKFIKRKEQGMNLSDRVWKITGQFKGELELALELGLGEGKSAADLSRDVRQYLREPSKLFRRVRNEKGQLRLSKAAQAYHPGQGVYRSSYKNALRLTATENNMAYRTADYERWQTMDFVIGIQIKLSNNHTLNGRPFMDICDTLQGTYPKTFKFVGWHPFCRCIAVPKLADEDEFIAQQQALIDGRESDVQFSGVVTEMPGNFVTWMQENEERISAASTEPYFIRDNRNVIKRITAGESPIDMRAVNTQRKQDTAVPKPGKPLATKEDIYPAPRIKASPLVEEFLSATASRYDEKKYKTIHDSITAWREVQEVDDTLRQLVENAKYKGELYRAMNLSEAEYKTLQLALVNNQENVTKILNRDLEIISWSKEQHEIMHYYAKGSKEKPMRVLIRTKEVTIRAYDHAMWAADGNMDKEVMLSKHTEWRYCWSRKKQDDLGEYYEIWVEPAKKKRRKK